MGRGCARTFPDEIPADRGSASCTSEANNAMRFVGRIEEWNDDRGFGFVTPNGGGERVFAHIKAFESKGRRPLVGDLISYEAVADDRRRLNALRIRFIETSKRIPVNDKDWIPRRFAGGFSLLAVSAASYTGKVPLLLALIYTVMSLITFFAYWRDKAAARANRWRTQESSLHILGLLGGWPGALIAQGSFRHKTRKRSFQIGFWLVLAINVFAVAWLVQTGRVADSNEWLLSVVSGRSIH